MELDRQIEISIDDAANYGIPPIVIERAIAPVLKLFAEQLQHTEYYVLQNLEESWVLTTIANPQLKQQKKVIYAFISVRDAAISSKNTPDAIAAPIGIVQLLLRLLALEQVDSIIFLEDSRNLNRGIEIKRDHLLKAIEAQIARLKQIPPHIA